MRRFLHAAWCVVGLATGCPGGVSPGSREVEHTLPSTPDPELLGRLRAAPESLTLAGQTLTLSTFIWRDFMPISPPGGRPLIAAITVAGTGTTFPGGLDARRLWLIRGDEVWDAPLAEAEVLSSPGRLQKKARGGPKWPPGEKIDVVVELVGDGAKTHLLRRAGEMITSTH